MHGWRAVAGLTFALALLAPGVARAAPEQEMDVTVLVDQVRPSVVGILVSTRSDDPSHPEENHAAGTGFVYREGVILTNAHVVQDAIEVQVLWSDGTVTPVPAWRPTSGGMRRRTSASSGWTPGAGRPCPWGIRRPSGWASR